MTNTWIDTMIALIFLFSLFSLYTHDLQRDYHSVAKVWEWTIDPPRQMWFWNLILSASGLVGQREGKVIAWLVLVVVGNVTLCFWTAPSLSAGASPHDIGEQLEGTVSELGWQKYLCHSFIRDSQRGIEILGFCGDCKLHIKCLSGNLITWAW